MRCQKRSWSGPWARPSSFWPRSTLVSKQGSMPRGTSHARSARSWGRLTSVPSTRPWTITNSGSAPPVSRVPDLASRIRDAALLEGDFVLSSGERSSFYVDKYLFSTEPHLLADVGDALAAQIPEEVERLAGVELGAVPLVEDVVTTGTQAVKAARNLVAAEVDVVTIVAVLDRREETGEELGGFTFRSLLRMDDLRVVKPH